MDQVNRTTTIVNNSKDILQLLSQPMLLIKNFAFCGIFNYFNLAEAFSFQEIKFLIRFIYFSYCLDMTGSLPSITSFIEAT